MLVTVTVAPGRTAPVVSWTTPSIVLLTAWDWDHAETARTLKRPRVATPRILFITSSEELWDLANDTFARAVSRPVSASVKRGRVKSCVRRRGTLLARSTGRRMALSLKADHLARYKDIVRLLIKYGRSDLVKHAGLDDAV